jgi:hypothetical protein
MIIAVGGLDAKNCKGQLIFLGRPSETEIDSDSVRIDRGPTQHRLPPLEAGGAEYLLTFLFYVPRGQYDNAQYRFMCDGVITPLTPIELLQ